MSFIYAPTWPEARLALNVAMRRAARDAWSPCTPVRRHLATSTPFTSLSRRISLSSASKTTFVSRRTLTTSSQWTCTPRTFPCTGIELLDQSVELDEETLPTYQPEKYYPVTQGEIFNDRYQAIAKIGYGVTSTVWLAKDLM